MSQRRVDQDPAKRVCELRGDAVTVLNCCELVGIDVQRDARTVRAPFAATLAVERSASGGDPPRSGAPTTFPRAHARARAVGRCRGQPTLLNIPCLGWGLVAGARSAETASSSSRAPRARVRGEGNEPTSTPLNVFVALGPDPRGWGRPCRKRNRRRLVPISRGTYDARRHMFVTSLVAMAGTSPANLRCGGVRHSTLVFTRATLAFTHADDRGSSAERIVDE